MSEHLCPHCRQPMPVEQRRDPPLPRLDHPNVVTIHDLPADARSKAKVQVVHHSADRRGMKYSSYHLRLDERA